MDGNVQSAKEIPGHRHQTVGLVILVISSLWKQNHLSSFTKSKQAPNSNCFIPSPTFLTAGLVFLHSVEFFNKQEVLFPRPAENAGGKVLSVHEIHMNFIQMNFLSGRRSVLALEMSV